MSTTHKITVDSAVRQAERLVDMLVDSGPMTGAECCEALGWSRGRFDAAIRTARDVVLPPLDLAIPHPIPDNGWRYEVTAEWQPVEAGASHALGVVESRLRSIHRDVAIVKPHLTKGTREWRRANFLDRHLSHILSTLKEINDGEG